MCTYTILALITVTTGLFGGLVKFFNSIDTSKPINLKEFLKYLLTGIGAAILIPLFLNMISSDLISAEKIEIHDYFVYTGFCFIAAYLSDRFLSTIGDKILNEVNKVKNKQESTSKTVELLVDNETSPIDASTNENPNKAEIAFQNLSNKIEKKDTGLINEILNAFEKNEKYTFRSVKGISKEFNYPENTVEILIKAFEENGLIQRIKRRADGQFLYGLTSLGKLLKTHKK
jgi:hypothetical protein